ncbi:related to MTD1 - methylenetetrahydrofolate dehydrogenase (NAD+) [Ustilago trichophora]|uniref:Related to MTD1 - methylenetetrahydrofolate dehydrogenase (NAD+) n=1 Tax=Ustilago trichophora TaxID=86804 RepID=A0A5C3E715_9BASI|nr:related to MTD1 - methylenetetrahydrofolate dehydrogenase (NAD+) [Ustilago trichophora]
MRSLLSARLHFANHSSCSTTTAAAASTAVVAAAMSTSASKLLAPCSCSRSLTTDTSFLVTSSATAQLASTFATSVPSVRGSTPSLASSVSSSASTSLQTTPTLRLSSAFHTTSQTSKSDLSGLDLSHLNSLLDKLARPSSLRSSPATESFSSPSNSASSSSSALPLTPRLRGKGTFREPSYVRTERKAQFNSLLDTFHRATVCDFEPSYQLSASDLVHAFDHQGNSISPVQPNDVLRGVASSMSEPIVQHSSQPGSVPSAENPGKLVQASGIAAPYQDAIKEAIQARLDQGKSRPKLVGILATPSPPSVAYAEWTRKACEAVGIEFEIWKTWDDSVEVKEEDHKGSAPDFDLEADVEDLIIAANADDKVHGIMVYYPIFFGRQDTYLQQIVDPRKDVEGLHFSYCWNMYHNVRWISPAKLGNAPGTTRELPEERATREALDGEQVPPGMAKSILPCTPLAMVKCLEAIGVYDRDLPYGDRLYGKTITVINRSEVVGRPLAALLSNDGAKVYSVDIDSIQEFNKRAAEPSSEPQGRARSEIVKKAHAQNTASQLRPHHVVRNCNMTAEECIRASDVVISGVPSANYKVETEWIKPGAVCVNFSSEKNFKPDVRTRASMYLPAIGKTTIAMLQRNLLRLVEYRELSESTQ